MVFGLLGFSLFVFVVGGAVLAVYSWGRIRRLERSVGKLAEQLGRLAEGRLEAPVPSAATEPESPPTPSRVEPIEAPGFVAPLETAETGAERPQETVPEPEAPAVPRIEPIPDAPGMLDLETLVAGRWLNRVAIIALLMAAAFFLKYAFDNDWIGTRGRVALGLVAGAVLMVAGQWLLGRGYRYFSEGIAALGGGVLFLSLYAAWSFYSLIPQPVAFGGMVIVTSALAGLALGRSSERLAVLALISGLITPGLLATGADPQIERFSYLAVLTGGFLAVAWRRTWRWLAPIALAGFLGYLVDWADAFYSAEKLGSSCLFASIFFVQFGVFLALRARSESPLNEPEQLLIPFNALWFGIVLSLLLYEEHRWWLTLGVLVVAGLHLGGARLLREVEEGRARTARLVFAGLALTFATAAIAIRLEGQWITIAWALEGALLVWAGFRSSTRTLRLAGMVLFAAVISLLLAQSGEDWRPFLNERFASFAAAVAAFAMCGVWARAHWHELEIEEQKLFLAIGVATNVLALWSLSEEVWSLLGSQRWSLEPRLAQQMGVSLLWIVAAGILVFLGARRGSAAMRWQGLALIGLAICKVFLVDLSFLERAYRIASFLVLGVVLLAVSFWYQRNLLTSRDDVEPEDLE